MSNPSIYPDIGVIQQQKFQVESAERSCQPWVHHSGDPVQGVKLTSDNNKSHVDHASKRRLSANFNENGTVALQLMAPTPQKSDSTGCRKDHGKSCWGLHSTPSITSETLNDFTVSHPIEHFQIQSSITIEACNG